MPRFWFQPRSASVEPRRCVRGCRRPCNRRDTGDLRAGTTAGAARFGGFPPGSPACGAARGGRVADRFMRSATISARLSLAPARNDRARGGIGDFRFNSTSRPSKTCRRYQGAFPVRPGSRYSSFCASFFGFPASGPRGSGGMGSESAGGFATRSAAESGSTTAGGAGETAAGRATGVGAMRTVQAL